MRRRRDGGRAADVARAKILFPFVGHRAVRARAAGDAAARVGRARRRRARLPRHGAAAAAARRAGRAGVRRGVRGLRGDRAAGAPRSACRSTARIARGRNVRHALRQLMAEVPARRGSSSRPRRTAPRRLRRRRRRLAAAQRARRGGRSCGPTRERPPPSRASRSATLSRRRAGAQAAPRGLRLNQAEATALIADEVSRRRATGAPTPRPRRPATACGTPTSPTAWRSWSPIEVEALFADGSR